MMRFQLRSSLSGPREIQAKDRHPLFFSVNFQLEPIFQKRLQHQSHVFFGWLPGLGSCVDVKFIRYRPTRQTAHQSTTKFDDVDPVGEDEQGDEGLVRC